MATAVTYGPGNIAADTTRKPSSSIWHDCPIQEIRAGFVDGYMIEDDFMELPVTAVTTQATAGKYKASSSTGTITSGAGLGGEVVLTTAGDNESSSIAYYSFPFKLNTSQKKFWFEARYKISTIATQSADVFLGLLETATISTTVPITATTGTTGSGVSAISDNNMVGFFHSGGNISGVGDNMSTVYNANGITKTALGSLEVTLVADTYQKLGMVFDPVDNYLYFFADGVQLTTRKLMTAALGTEFPDDVNLGLVFAQVGAASVSTLSTLDWWRAVQLA